MFSEALRIMDQNTVIYMIDELKAKIAQKDSAIAEKDSTIAALQAEIDHLRSNNTHNS